MTALERLERRIDTELCLDAYPYTEGVDLGYHARSLVRQGYTEQARGVSSMSKRIVAFKNEDAMRATAPALLELAVDLKVWLARAAVSGTYDVQGLQSFRDAARALISKAEGA